MSDVAGPLFPPLFEGIAVSGLIDPFDKACSQAVLGCDAGLVVHNISTDTLRAAIVFAPEVNLKQAMAVMIACGIGFQNALGALAPPEVAVHLTWQGGILVNGAACGHLRIAAAVDDPTVRPDWIVVGLEIPLIPPSGEAPGETPDETSLFEEGCVEVDPVELLEAWVRHTLVWVNHLEQDGNERLHADWRGLVKGLGEEIQIELGGERYQGTFLGVDENFGMLLRDGKDTRLLSLSGLLKKGDG